MKVRVTVDGGPRLQAGLARSAAQMDRPTEALRQAGQAIARAASRLAAKRTGRMSRANKVKVLTTVARVTNRTRYAPFQEHGTHIMNAHPFLRPAAETTNVTPYFERYAEGVLRRNLK